MIPQVNSIITLHVAEEKDRVLWVTETPREVRDQRRYAIETNGLVILHRVRGLAAAEFSTLPSNIVNIEENV